MNTTLDLLAHPIVLAAAEEMAREWSDIRTTDDLACEAAMGARYYLFDQLDVSERKEHTEKMARLLCDLSRPASRDWWARWLAEKVGMMEGATAPGRRHYDDDKWPMWALVDPNGGLCAFYDMAGRFPLGHYEVTTKAVPGISALTNPAEALALAVMAALAPAHRSP